MFGSDIHNIKILNILITTIGVIFVLAKSSNQHRLMTLFVILLWLLLPIVTNSVHITDPDSNLGWLIVLLIYLYLDKFFMQKLHLVIHFCLFVFFFL